MTHSAEDSFRTGLCRECERSRRGWISSCIAELMKKMGNRRFTTEYVFFANRPVKVIRDSVVYRERRPIRLTTEPLPDRSTVHLFVLSRAKLCA